ncbi:MAG: Rab family GTPase [Candidatus Hermodarchaeota archaeon]
MTLDVEYVFKVVIVGPRAVGKTTLVRRYTGRVFMEGAKRTIGVDFSLQKVDINQTKLDPPVRQISLQLWDFAGESRFETVLPYYLAGTDIALLAFDCSRVETFEPLPHWLRAIRNCVPTVPIILVSMKNDLEAEVPSAAIKEFMQKETIKHFFQTSSKTGQNIDEVFHTCVNYALEYLQKSTISPQE